MKTDLRPFHFKHFSLYHHRSTMKVGTDAVLLGAWTELNPSDSAIDIGTGCGILPLMLAQRGAAQVDAVELHEASANEAAENFAASQWAKKLTIFNQNVIDFSAGCSTTYDLVISNPPFFTSLFKTKQSDRRLARHTDTLSFEDLIMSALKLMKPDGRLSVVLPVDESQHFLQIAYLKGLTERKRMQIIPVEGRAPNRINIELVKNSVRIIDSVDFTIRKQNGEHTDQYQSFLQEFYLGL